MKAILEFNLPEDQEEYETHIKATDFYLALWDTGQKIFRPARKHGYDDAELNALLEKIGDDGYELVSKLEAKFWEICNAHGVAEKL